MKAVGLITEYNPMHNGHIYHMQESMKISKADLNIIVMSGNFVQRGEPAIIDKYARCEACINSGANLVVELPAYYALSSAEGFATGAIKTLNAFQVDSIVFGSESGNLDLFKTISNLLCEEPPSYRDILKKELAKGNSYPLARQLAVQSYLNMNNSIQDSTTLAEIESILSSPNNILGIEYLKALHHYAEKIKPYTIVRKGSGYNETTIGKMLPSATAIRNLLDRTEQSDFPDLKELIPPAMLYQMQLLDQKSSPILADDFTALLNYKLEHILHQCNYNKNETALELSSYLDVPMDLANRITETFDASLSLSEFSLKLKTKQYTLSRINRCLFHIILDMKKVNYTKYTTEDIPYIRVLGFDEKGQKYLSHIKKKCTAPIITKTANYKDLLQDDIYITNIYNQVIIQKFHYKQEDEFRKGIYIKKSTV